MKDEQVPKIGGIIFLTGIIFIAIAWYYSYPIKMSSLTDFTFFQFHPFLWPGMALGLIGIFLMAFYTTNKLLVCACSSLVFILINIDAFFYSYIPSSDSGAARGMFQVFQKVDVNTQIIPYFKFPSYFNLNEILSKIVTVDEKGAALISFALYGALLGIFLYLFFLNLKKFYYNTLIPFLLVLIYCIGIFSFINYQWVPQTLALVYLFLLLAVTCYLYFDGEEPKWSCLIVVLFIPFVFCHPFMPVIFLSFFGLLMLKKRDLAAVFLIMVTIYILVTVFYATTYLSLYIRTFQQSITGFNTEYRTVLTTAFHEPENQFSQFISLINRFTVPFIWILLGLGTAILFIKRKIDYVLIAVGLAGGIYLTVGLFYSVLGLRAAQILLIFMSIGIMLYITKWRKLTVSLIIIILVLTVFGPMRIEYNNTHFQTDEEAVASTYLADTIRNVSKPTVGIGQVNWGYFTNIYSYDKNRYQFEFAFRPGNQEFLKVFNTSMKKSDFILYDTNMGKEISRSVMTSNQLDMSLARIEIANNKIFDSGSTFIMNGFHY